MKFCTKNNCNESTKLSIWRYSGHLGKNVTATCKIKLTVLCVHNIFMYRLMHKIMYNKKQKCTWAISGAMVLAKIILLQQTSLSSPPSLIWVTPVIPHYWDNKLCTHLLNFKTLHPRLKLSLDKACQILTHKYGIFWVQWTMS